MTGVIQAPSTESQRKRLLAIASSGGHWIELARSSPAFDGFDTLYVSTAAGLRVPSGHRELRTTGDASQWEPLKILPLAIELLGLVRSFRPDVIVSTGAAPGLLAIVIGKLLGVRTVWIDSIANADRLSLSGRLARGWADVRLTQWPHLADEKQKVRFIGRVI